MTASVKSNTSCSLSGELQSNGSSLQCCVQTRCRTLSSETLRGDDISVVVLDKAC